MTRLALGVLLLVTTSFVVPDTLRSREDYLRQSWEDFTPGAVSAPVSALWYETSGGNVSGRRSWTLALLTEDRNLRLFDIEGETVLELRVALRAAVDLLQERSGAVILVDRFGTLRRVNLGTGAVTEVIRTGLESRAGWIDQQGNFYMVSESGEIAHVSAAGMPMWRRSVPAPVHTVVTASEELLLAANDGSVLRFDTDGRGRVVFRGDEPFLEIRTVAVRGRSLLGGVDAAGTLSMIERGSSGGLLLWSVPVGRGTSINGIDHEGRSWLTTRDERLLLVDENGTTEIEIDLSGIHPDRIAVDARRMKAYVVDGDNRIRTIGSTGRVEAVLQLRQRPQTLDHLPETGELVVRYENWLLEVFRTTGRSLPVDVSLGVGSQPREDEDFPGALRTLAASVMNGPSERERSRLVDDLRERMHAAQLYGQVSSIRRVLIDLAAEVYSAPTTRRGEDHGGKDFPGIRLRAVDLLGFFSDVTSRDALTQAVARDPDPRVAVRALELLAAAGNDEFNALERGFQRFRGGDNQERTTLAPGLVGLLEALTGDIAVHAEATGARVRQIATELAASAVSEDLRRRAMNAARHDSNRD